VSGFSRTRDVVSGSARQEHNDRVFRWLAAVIVVLAVAQAAAARNTGK